MMTTNLLVNRYRFLRSFFKFAFITLFVGLLVGCPANVSKRGVFDESKNSQYYLSQYLSTSGSEQTNWQLLAIRALIIEGNVKKAQQLIDELPSQLSPTQQKEVLLLKGELAVKNGKSFDVSQLSLAELSDNEKIRYYKIKIALDKQKKDVASQLRDYIELEKYGTLEQRHNAIDDTWNFLTSLNNSTISSILVYANESTLQGWIDLITTYNNNSNVYPVGQTDESEIVASHAESQSNLLKNAVNEWRVRYSNHPAALYLPRAILGEDNTLATDANKKNVALFLPLSGSSKVFSEAIRIGYFDANQLYPQEPQQNIKIYDTNSADLASLVKQAEQDGAELIVGPLLKKDVLSIMKLSSSLPVLSLNKVDSSDLFNYGSKKICFFALSPEDEASDAAIHIYGQKKNSPLLIVPRNELGQRIVSRFTQQWRLNDPALGGVYVQYFDSAQQLRQKMNSGSGIELEGELATSNQELSSSFSSSSSSQFDAIYIYASYDEMTLIKSMLEMKSKKVKNKVIPTIYAGSRGNTADVTQDFRYDMDKLQFSDIPLILSKPELIENLPNSIKNDYSLVRLYAMGLDAWQLANRFNQLKAYQTNILDGMTGRLSVASNCEITRSLTWQQYIDGKETPLLENDQ